MQVAKRQHYVSQFYLKNFSIHLNRKSIGIFNVQREKYIPQASLRGQAYQDYFYGKDGSTENALSSIEKAASRIVENYDAGCADSTTISPRSSAFFIA